MRDPDTVALENIARVAHEANRAYCATLGDHSQPAWDAAPGWQVMSAVQGVMDIRADIAAGRPTPPERSHERWLEQKREHGWTYGEEKDPDAKTHPCMVPYDDLPLEQRRKDYLFTGIVRALLEAA